MIIFFSLPFQTILTWLHTEGDCRVSNTQMFQGQNVEIGTFESQPVRESNLVFDRQNIIQFENWLSSPWGLPSWIPVAL